MRRVLRVLLRTAAVACIAVAIVTAAFWPISYRHIDIVALRVAPHHAIAVGDRQGRVMAGLISVGPGRWIETERFDVGPPDNLPDDPPGSRLGFYVEFGPESYVMLPTPVAILFLLALSALAWQAARRLVPRPDSARCAVCGYDLRATPDRCPECGTIP